MQICICSIITTQLKIWKEEILRNVSTRVSNVSQELATVALRVVTNFFPSNPSNCLQLGGKWIYVESQTTFGLKSTILGYL